ncbi:copper resistance protein NlpE N-terminal domain-containing protein [Fibrobacter sp. UWEL]|uniref:copper resistance protein NlpE N-terminal domain-containing protein n=1 Tax=Fibrobacter sp. UWEL TaxID=1896209 RepID=UPI000913E35B|nr:copper resistance protein NlpE N-terminal domain-containing protein [Fibrobacter sp. UWEL]SHK76247.1 NlpE N-terminal domain-containing protein [Fibrobacter sp. UWEL]
MNIFSARFVFSGAVVLSTALLLSGCSEEKKEPLPDLPPIELPKDVPALYSGQLPCDDCKAKMVQMTLKDDMSVVAVQNTFKETSVVDTLKGTYVVTDSTIKISLSDNTIHWTFKRIGSGNLSYMTSAGTVYEDADGMTADFIKIYRPVPAKVAE